MTASREVRAVIGPLTPRVTEGVEMEEASQERERGPEQKARKKPRCGRQLVSRASGITVMSSEPWEGVRAAQRQSIRGHSHHPSPDRGQTVWSVPHPTGLRVPASGLPLTAPRADPGEGSFGVVPCGPLATEELALRRGRGWEVSGLHCPAVLGNLGVSRGSWKVGSLPSPKTT